MRRSGKGAGGGLGMNKVTKQSVKTGQPARAMNPRGVSQIGSNIGNHATDGGKKLTRGVEPVRGALKPSGGPGGVPLGNAVALNVGRGSPGAGRAVHRCGSQQGVSPVRQLPAGRDALSGE